MIVWHYHDSAASGPERQVRLSVAGLSNADDTVTVKHYRIDRDHSNAYTVWKQMGWPQYPNERQRARLKDAARLDQLSRPRRVKVRDEQLTLEFPMPRQSVSLIDLSW